MNTRVTAALFVLIMLPACSSDEVKRAAYEAAYQKGCMDRTGTAHCDPQHKSYDQYKKDRQQLLKQDPSP